MASISEIYYALIIFPILFITTLSAIFSSAVEQIEVEQTKANCPYPINSGIANITAQQLNFPPNVNYTIDYDTDADDYHVTIFRCTEDFVTHLPQVDTLVYTADLTNNWFDITSKASGYMFYISESITAFFQKAIASATILYLMINAPAEVTGLTFMTYVNAVLFSFIALGGFMVVRG